MPHTNRKKKVSGAEARQPPKSKTIHVKRQEIEDDDGWTHIVDSKKAPRKREIETCAPKKAWEGDGISGDAAIVNMTVAEMEAEQQRSAQQWQSSPACAELKTLLAPLRDQMDVDQVICLGLGTLQDWKLQARRTSHVQLAALQTVVAELGLEKSKHYVQEPRFTDLDRALLKSRNFEVVDDPQAFAQIQTRSLVFAIHCYPKLYQSILGQTHPALLIANDLSAYSDNTWTQLSDSDELLGHRNLFLSSHEAFDFPRYRHDFTDTKIYHSIKITSGS